MIQVTKVEVGSRINSEIAKKLCKQVFLGGEMKLILPGIPLSFRLMSFTEDECEEELNKITAAIDGYGGDYVIRQVDERGLTLAYAS